MIRRYRITVHGCQDIEILQGAYLALGMNVSMTDGLVQA